MKQSRENEPHVPAIDLIEKLRKELPVTFSRQFISERLGGLLSTKTLANLDARQEGPANRMSIGRKIAYDRDNFLAWLEKRMKNMGE